MGTYEDLAKAYTQACVKEVYLYNRKTMLKNSFMGSCLRTENAPT